jgi:enoyl-CoA hydratase/carnithine racemase
MNFIKIGLIPDGGAHFFLEKLVGESIAKQIIWKGEKMSADEAQRLGIIHEVVENNIHIALEAKVEEWLNEPIQAMIRQKLPMHAKITDIYHIFSIYIFII